ncbi:hypothetical protein C8F04DRAFT_1402063 [Mycena alexandri]|uniref:Uncharacterized protein n=1 Tax=Mycena alexandri TaxID=1745969 RepID=A0AAD6S8Q4_9AGAR|nr:hypothetical protein C8F04DRAFT_1402063 [Mycena alexandri]
MSIPAANAPKSEFPPGQDFQEHGIPDQEDHSQRFPPCLRPRAPYELYSKPPVMVEGNDEIKTLLDSARVAKEERAGEFLDESVRVVRVFLSSYLRNQGIVYADRNHRRAPLTAELAKALPDEFTSACKAWWGRRVDGEPEMGEEPYRLHSGYARYHCLREAMPRRWEPGGGAARKDMKGAFTSVPFPLPY